MIGDRALNTELGDRALNTELGDWALKTELGDRGNSGKWTVGSG